MVREGGTGKERMRLRWSGNAVPVLFGDCGVGPGMPGALQIVRGQGVRKEAPVKKVAEEKRSFAVFGVTFKDNRGSA